jgi:TonB family protein
MTRSLVNERTFKRAMVYSAVFHAVLFTLIALSPSMPKPGKKGMVHYISFGGFPGGGGGSGGGGPKAAAVQAPAKKETLRDLAVASKIKPQAKPSMTYPVDKPKKDRAAKDPKKTAISKPQPNVGAPTDAALPAGSRDGAGQSGSGAGSGVRIGLGDGTGVGGLGSGYGDQIGLSDFPYQYYLQIISDRVSSSWFTALVDPGVAGTFYTTVYFKILRNGQVADLKIKESSGIASLDMSAQRAIQISAPFPPLPSDYDGAYLGIHLIFEHSK